RLRLNLNPTAKHFAPEVPRMGTPSLILCWALLGQAADPAAEPRYPLDEAPRQLQPAPAYPADEANPLADAEPSGASAPQAGADPAAEPARPADRYPPLDDAPAARDPVQTREDPAAERTTPPERYPPAEQYDVPQRSADDPPGED